MKEIPLSNPAAFGRVTLVDDQDYELLSKHVWGLYGGYVVRNAYCGRVAGKGIRKMIRMHRLILDAPAELQVDHINGDPLNNRRANLRICTATENRRNAKRRSDNSTGYKGVHYRPDMKAWVACIRHGGRRKHLGTFHTPELAARAYNEAAVAEYGEFARLNEVA